MALLLNYINAVLYPSVSTCKCVWVWKINTHFLCIILLGGLHIPLIDTSCETRCLSQSHSTLQNNLWSLNLLPIKPTSTGHTRTLLQLDSWTFLHSVWVIFIKHPTHSGWKLFLIRSLSSNIFLYWWNDSFYSCQLRIYFKNDKSGISCIWVYVLVYKATCCGFKNKQTNFNTTDIYMQINMLHVPPWC